MESNKLMSDCTILAALELNGFKAETPEQGRLRVTELAVKANAGYYNSHTEEALLNSVGVLKKNRQLNKYGREFICSMLYKHSNNKSDFVTSSEKYRR